MSLPEIGYRTAQFWQKRKERKAQQGYFPSDAKLLQWRKSILPIGETSPLMTEHSIPVFGQYFSYDQLIVWHLDISSEGRFPKTFAKDINIRTSEYGSAKHVWEINRLQFLPLLALRYRHTGNSQFLIQFRKTIESWIEENPYLIGVN
ncbi:MAG: hypothetical protein ACFB15_19945 [Cyclobacteriaceae bacterium]